MNYHIEEYFIAFEEIPQLQKHLFVILMRQYYFFFLKFLFILSIQWANLYCLLLRFSKIRLFEVDPFLLFIRCIFWIWGLCNFIELLLLLPLRWLNERFKFFFNYIFWITFICLFFFFILESWNTTYTGQIPRKGAFYCNILRLKLIVNSFLLLSTVCSIAKSRLIWPNPSVFYGMQSVLWANATAIGIIIWSDSLYNIHITRQAHIFSRIVIVEI